MDLRILSAGAAKGVVQALQQEFQEASGAVVQGVFGAVGVIREKLLANEPCDVIILTAAQIEELGRTGLVLAGSSAPLGRVRTGIAVRAGEALPDISSRDALKACLLASDGIYFPDPERATAGIHFVNVLKRLGIHEQLAPKLRPYPNGATAMHQLAQTTEPRFIGCTQITEIKYTEGVTLAGLLPEEFELATVYSAAVCSRAADAVIARRFIRLLVSEKSQTVRAQGGFEF